MGSIFPPTAQGSSVAIQVGQILDKYELIEQVGQGGMAVVYRGLDRSLQRTVAIKVLHGHLAGDAEARARFEREARAVAKLRHENILEIFAFSGKDSVDAYIITEFIDGQTLREFMNDHHIEFPEIGALITVKLCQALGHAHGAGILHRDIKPENIMIRGDGVVKLMDFGIAQMLDMQRMTVTGQLLGSPAYMAPELLEGDRLDFRTDIFAVGIVLYQLVTGVLPFRGKNPHEILKRIAECRFEDPQKTNPRVGRELGRIITTALARDPNDRFADISEMTAALEKYLNGSGLTEHSAELGRFFASPRGYEMALRERLLHHLRTRGEELCEGQPVVALELFNRVLTIDPDNAEVMAIIEHMSRRGRWLRVGVLCAGLVLLGVVAWQVMRGLGGSPDPAAPTAANATLDAGSPPDASLYSMLPDDVPGPSPGPSPGRSPDRETGQGADASVVALVGPDPAHAGDASSAGGDPGVAEHFDARKKHAARPPRPRVARDAAPAAALAERTFTLRATPRDSEFRVDQGPWRSIDEHATFRVGPGAHTLEIRNDECCHPANRTIGADWPGGDIPMIRLVFLPARITPRCPNRNVVVQIDGRITQLDRPFDIFTGTLGRQEVEVTFIGERTDTHRVKVKFNDAKDVTCRFE